MALDESDENMTALEHDGFMFQFEERIKHVVENAVIDYIETFWQKGLTIQSSAGGTC
ncbi:MAG: hypothetical protein PQJ61_08575 [Spirochaetales bacterium]|uniref:Uncharacterized protein n=1 Tax=Candidatus Thalassospirochaeta sargassi TaxID=3119039 RepID=A0AAJ1ICL7_9SPIO|nr:hypothetical protein [Spirochaetales bacterium]